MLFEVVFLKSWDFFSKNIDNIDMNIDKHLLVIILMFSILSLSIKYYKIVIQESGIFPLLILIFYLPIDKVSFYPMSLLE